MRIAASLSLQCVGKFHRRVTLPLEVSTKIILLVLLLKYVLSPYRIHLFRALQGGGKNRNCFCRH